MKSKEASIRFVGAVGLTIAYFTLTLLFLCTSDSFAADLGIGVVEISQKNVPFVITKPGSYRLVSNLNVSSLNATAISIATDNVTIDLNGFTIGGPGTQPGVTAGFGIANAFPSPGLNKNVVVRGGTIQDFDYGVHLAGMNNRVESIHVYNTSHGIFVGRSSVVSQCQVSSSYATGIGTDDGCMVLNNTIYSTESTQQAINTSGGASPVGGNTVMGNNIRFGHKGIRVRGQGNRIEGKTITLCETGIDLSEGTQNYFAKNLLLCSVLPWSGEIDDTNGDSIDPALSNVILLP